MQSKEFITLAKKSFRQLRKGESKFVKDLAKETGISWPTTKCLVEELKSKGYLKETSGEKLMISHAFRTECYAGVYLSNNSIYFSVIDFTGKEICFESQNFDDGKSFYNILKEKISSFKEIKAISICSDNILINPNGSAMIPNIIFLDDRLIREFLSKEANVYFEKTYISNSWKYYEDYGFKDDELNVVISFHEDTYGYTIWNNGKVVQARKYPEKIKDADALYLDVIVPIWKILKPDNIIFITSSESECKLIQEKSYEWSSKIYYMHNSCEQVFEKNELTRLIAVEQSHPSEAAALHAMYNYYGWID